MVRTDSEEVESMNIYKIKMSEGDLSPVDHYVLAENFKEAERIADKILIEKLKTWKDSEIMAIVKEFEIEVVK
jgi:hypothetical protein